MKLRTIVGREIRERPAAMTTSVLTILLGVAALVAIRHVTFFSEQEVNRQLATLGANILVLPKSASVQDYYSADRNNATIAEEHASKILLANLAGVEKLSPKLCVSTELNGQEITLTGILPQNEFEAKAAWQTVNLFTKKKHVGCKKAACGPKSASASPESLATERTIQQLGKDEAVIGSDIAEKLSLKPGASISLFDQKFQVNAVLPATGTVDDSRVFVHLHKVQEMSKLGEVVSAIEVLGCCEDAAGQLVPQLSELLPDTKVVTISQVVQTQVGVNRLLAKTSLLVLVVLVLVAGVSVMSAMFANVRERRREIGTMMALGAAPHFVLRMFLLKATWLGLAGGLGGSLCGMLLAVWLGPAWAGVSVSPLVDLMIIAGGAAWLLAMLAALWPARHAAQLDPCICFQEV